MFSDAKHAEQWILQQAERAYELAAVALGGGDWGRWLAGRLAVALFIMITAVSFRLVARELRNMAVQASAIAGQLGDIAYSLFKAVLGGAVFAMLFMWTRRLVWFVFPGAPDVFAAAAADGGGTGKRVLQDVVSQTSWFALDWWQRIGTDDV